jgi:hypothetical protein
MAENPVQLYNIQYRRLFPWLHLTRAFWIAVDIRKLILAGVALLLISGGSLVFDQLPFGAANTEDEASLRDGERWPWQWSLGYDLWHGGDGPAELRGLMHDPQNTLRRVAGNWQVVLRPFRDFVQPAAVVFRGDASVSELADAITRSLWSLCIWSIFGGAICRIAALQFARDQQVGVRGALIFSASRFFGYFSAPLMPLAGVGVLWLLCIIGGWIGRIPGGVGPGVLGILWGLELLFGFLMAVILLGVAVGWPLMFATISVEGTDGFDGLSRAYNYVFERPLYFLWQAVVTMLFGSLAIFFVWLMAQLLTHLSLWGVSWGLGFEQTVELVAGSPELVGAGLADGESGSFGAGIARGWMCALAVLVMAFVYTFFWSSSTITYFLLRHSVDANDFDEVFIEDVEEKDELLPLVGTAAMGEAARPPAAAAPAAHAVPPPVDLTP